MGKFIILQVADGFKFYLKAKNGETLIFSPSFVTASACRKVITYINENIPFYLIEDQTVSNYETKAGPKFEIYKEKNKSFHFKLRTGGENIIAYSNPYTSKSNCMKGIESVKRNAAVFEILEKQA